jgi:DNA-directed RNA polymerase specialized sigma24 family protein
VPGSITHWIWQLKNGDQAAAQQLWECYYRRLVSLARARLHGQPRRVADEEDVALSAFDSFCRGAAEGRFPQLADRDNLWPLLVVITSRKAADLIEYENRQKRSGGDEVAELNGLLSQDPSPAFALEMAEACQRLLGLLGDPTLQAVAVWKMEGYSEIEIANRLGCVPRSVRRKLRAIRQLWSQEAPP